MSQRPLPLIIDEYMEYLSIYDVHQAIVDEVIRLALYYSVNIQIKEFETSGFWFFKRYTEIRFKVSGEKTDVEDFVDMVYEKAMNNWE